MMHGRNKVVCILGGLVLCGPLYMGFAAGENPYAAITERNVFALKPPPAAPDPETLKPPPPNIMLTGITTIFGNKRAIMRTPPVPGKPGEAARELSFFLAEGQQDGDLEVLQIDEKSGTVKIKYGGTPLSLTFEKNAPKIAGGGLPGPPGAPGAPGGAIPPPPTSNPFNPTADGGFKGIPTRTLRLPNAASPANPAGASYTPSSYNGVPTMAGSGVTVQNGANSINLNTLNQPAATQQIQPNWPPEVPMTAEEQSVLHQVQAELHKNDPGFPGFPGEPSLNPTPNSTPTTPTTQTQAGANNTSATGGPLPDRPRGFGRPF